MDGVPFGFRGLSFFNALFNSSFNRDDGVRRAWVTKFRDNGVTALRVWCQWDFSAPHVFADVGPGEACFGPPANWSVCTPTGSANFPPSLQTKGWR